MTALSSTLRESISIGCSASDVHECLIAYFGRRDGVAPMVLLRAPIGDLALDREVVVSLSDLPSKPREHVMQVGWQAAGGGPYPIFIGSLACLPDDTESSRIELEGAYTIPGGLLGKAFDAAIGSHIAAAASHSLLQALVGIVEAARDRDFSRSQLTAKPYPPTYE